MHFFWYLRHSAIKNGSVDQCVMERDRPDGEGMRDSYHPRAHSFPLGDTHVISYDDGMFYMDRFGSEISNIVLLSIILS